MKFISHLAFTFILFSTCTLAKNNSDKFFDFSYDESNDKIFLYVDKIDYEFMYIGSAGPGSGGRTDGRKAGRRADGRADGQKGIYVERC